jgi:light-regulated signal transduction histidine kinase (bacteriophytochrome)
VELLFVLLIGLALMRLLRQALTRSRAARSDLELANANLQRQRVELLQAQARLSTLADDLTRSNRELRSFAYVASHDLRAPLRALSHYSRFLEEDCAAQLDEAGRQHIERIAAAARDMDALVAGLLAHSRAQGRA